MKMIESGDKIGIVCCSNGQKRTYKEKLKYLENTLLSIGLYSTFSDYIYEKEDAFSGTAIERAHALMKFYIDDEIKGIFDISGGDIANGILPYLDYEIVANNKVPNLIQNGRPSCFCIDGINYRCRLLL